MANGVMLVSLRNPPTARIERRHKGRSAQFVCQHGGERRFDPALLQQCRAEDYLARAHFQNIARRLQVANPAADLAIEAAHNSIHHAAIFADAPGGIEVDHLHQGILGEALDPIIEVIEFESFFLALH
jgi:hypothetical protein